MLGGAELAHLGGCLGQQPTPTVLAISKRVAKAVSDRLWCSDGTPRCETCARLMLSHPIPLNALPSSTNELVTTAELSAAFVCDMLKRYNTQRLCLAPIAWTVSTEYRQVHQLLALQTRLTALTYTSPPADASFALLTALTNLQRLHVRLNARLIPVIAAMTGLQTLSVAFGSQSVVKITEDNNKTSPFRSFGALPHVTTLRVEADSIKQLNALSEVTAMRPLRVIDLSRLSIASASRLTFLTKLRHLQTVLLSVRTPLTKPQDLAAYIKMPPAFHISVAEFSHDFDAARSLEPLTTLPPKHARGIVRRLVFVRNTSRLDEPLRRIEEFSSGGVEEITLTCCPNVSNAFFDAAPLFFLRDLTLEQCVKVTSLGFLSQCSCLTRIVLRKVNGLPEAELGRIAACPSLVSCELGSLRIATVGFLAGSRRLQHVVLDDLKISSVDVLVDLPCCTSLTLRACPEIPVLDLVACTKLRRLDIDNLPQASDCAFVGSLQLEWLALRRLSSVMFTSADIFELTHHATLRNLIVDRCPHATPASFDQPKVGLRVEVHN